MVNSTLNVNKSFKEQVEKCTNDAFGAITQHFLEIPRNRRMPVF